MSVINQSSQPSILPPAYCESVEDHRYNASFAGILDVWKGKVERVFWAGEENFACWIDLGSGVCGVWGTRLGPWGDGKVGAVRRRGVSEMMRRAGGVGREVVVHA
jgi:hypothetical protein